MRIFLISLVFYALFCASVVTGAVSQHDISITPGQPWQMVAQFMSSPGVSAERHGNKYVAYAGTGTMFSDGRLTGIDVEASTVNPSALLLSMTAEQTRVLSGQSAVWYLIYLPDTGPAMLLATGDIKEVRK